MRTYKVKVGVLTLTESRDVSIPQQVAAWHQTVRVEPGTYDVYAYLDAHDYRVLQLCASAEGVTVSSNFRSRIGAHYGERDNNRNGERAAVSVELPTYGRASDDAGLLGQAKLDDTLSRVEWEPRDIDEASATRFAVSHESVFAFFSSLSTSSTRMWRLEWTGGRVQVEPGQDSHQLALLARPIDAPAT